MALEFHMGFSFWMAPMAKPALLLMSLSLVGVSGITPPRFMKFSTWFSSCPSIWMLILILSLLMTWTSVLLLFMVSPNFLLKVSTLVTKVCRSSSVSVRRTMSSANRRLFIHCPCTLIPKEKLSTTNLYFSQNW